MGDRGPWILYYALAVAAAIVLALPARPDLLGWAVIIGSGVGAAIIRNVWLGAKAWSRTDISWILVFGAVYLPLALALRTWPFGP